MHITSVIDLQRLFTMLTKEIDIMKCTKIMSVISALVISLVVACGAFADAKDDISDILSSIVNSNYLEILKSDRRLYDGRIDTRVDIEMNGRERARAAIITADPFIFDDTIELDGAWFASKVGDKAAFEQHAKKLFGEPVDTSLLGAYPQEWRGAALVEGVPMLLEDMAEGDGSYTFTVLDTRIKVAGDRADAEIDVFSGGTEEEQLGRPTLRYTFTFKKKQKLDVNPSGYYISGVQITKLGEL